MKLLIAEDDPFFRRILQQLLGSEFEVSTAVDGNQAWKMLETEDGPRLAILDWVMPGMTGPEICRLVRTTPRIASTYLILLTDKNSAADITAGLRAGADDYLTKPFGPGRTSGARRNGTKNCGVANRPRHPSVGSRRCPAAGKIAANPRQSASSQSAYWQSGEPSHGSC